MNGMNVKALWKSILRLKNSIKEEGFSSDIQLSGDIIIKKKSSDSHYYFHDLELKRGSLSLDSATEQFLNLYLPYCFVPLLIQKRKYTWATAHFAQSLDGKIATHVGHSQWIGNKENQIHAHRMRALCDAVIVGAGTLERDKPQLTVRHVEGPNPARVIIGNGEYDFDCLPDDTTTIYQVGTKTSTQKNIQHINIPTGEFDDIECKAILEELFKLGIYSAYIEGGSYTSSRFLEDAVLDEVQLHIAPIIVGSGIDNFTLPLKDHLDQSIQFKKYHYFHMGNEIMFQGEIKK